MFGIRGTEQLSDRALTLISDTGGDKGGFHIELGDADILSRLVSFGLINPNTLIAGASPLSEKDLKTLQKSGATYVHTPGFQNKHASLPQSGINRGVGTSGTGFGVLQVLNSEFNRYDDPEADLNKLSEYIGTLIRGNSEFASHYFSGKPGIIEKDAAADIVVFDYVPVGSVTTSNYLQHLLFPMQSARAKMVMTGGRFIYNNYTYLTLDEDIIIEESQKAAKRLYAKFEKL